MGELISLVDRRRGRVAETRPRGRRDRPVFHFDLACPFSYLAIERVERLFGEVRWQPTPAEALHRGSPWPEPRDHERAWAAAERRAAELRLPLVRPLGHPLPVRAAMRAAQRAVECDRGGPFALAASRLAFCGGFDLEDPEALAEAAAAADMGLEDCLSAAGDASRDGALDAAARRLLAAGADRLPAIRAARVLSCGERDVAGAAAGLGLSRARP